MTIRTAVIIYDDSDMDIRLGLCFLWETLQNQGYQQWLNGADVLSGNFTNVEPCDIYLLNATLPMDLMVVLKHQGFNIHYMGNKFSVPVTFANSQCFDLTIIDAESNLSAIMFAYYVYMQHMSMGNRLDFLPQKVVSDSLNFVYNNNIVALVTLSLNTGVYIAGLNGPMLKHNIGNAITYTKSLDGRLNSFANSKGIYYV